jgi:uncharacterized protein YjbJ (UPF0337 family)
MEYRPCSGNDPSQYPEAVMLKEKVKARTEETKGKIKEVAGKVGDNKSMEQEGTTQKNAGKNKAEAKADTKSDTKADTKAEAKADTKSDTKADTKAEAKADTKSDTKADTKAEAKAGTKADAKADAGDDKKSAKSPSTPKAQEATALLRRDHKIVSDLFDEYEKTNVKAKKKSLVSQICADLTIHAQIEEEIFYPAVKEALKDKELVPEAIVEHATLKDLITEVEGMEPDGETFDAKIKVLSEYVKHHVKEEQNEMFPKATASKLDMMELGAQIASRKEELIAERSRRA